MQVLAALLGALFLGFPGLACGQARPEASGTTVFIPPAYLAAKSGALPELSEEDAKLAQVLATGTAMVQAKRQSEAIFLYFDRVASVYEARFKDKDVVYRAARALPEILLYMVQAANEGRHAVGVSMNWANAYFLKAYALADMNRLPEARAPLDRALALSPENARFLSELGYLHQIAKDWPAALATYKHAESAATGFSPEDLRNAELARAWRGMGYALVETKRITEAETLYRKCLALDQNDAAARRELQYVQTLKANRP